MASVRLPVSLVVAVAVCGPGTLLCFLSIIIKLRHQQADMRLEHDRLLREVQQLMKIPTSDKDLDASSPSEQEFLSNLDPGNTVSDPHAASRRLNQLWSVGTALGSGCFQVDDAASSTIDVSTATCNSNNCPACFITPTTLSQATTVTIAACSSARWGITGTATRNGVWLYTFINRDATYTMTVTDGTGSYKVPALSHITGYCASSASTADRLYFPSTTIPQLTVEGAATVNELTVSTTSALNGAISAGGDLTMAANKGISISGSGGVDMSGTGNFVMTSSGTFQTGSGANTLGGSVTLAANADLALSGTGGISIGGSGDFSMSTGAFTSGSGTNTLSGAVTLASGVSMTLSGSGGIDISGSGSLTMGTGAFTSGSGTNTLQGDVTVTGSFLDTPALKIGSQSITCGYTDITTGTPTTDGQNLCTDGGR